MRLPTSDVRFNSFEYETSPLVTPNGFREYDVRWLFEKEINLLGAQAFGLGLGTYFHEAGATRVVTGHDYRSYSRSIQNAVVLGLLSAGCEVVDIGLAISPMAYYAQFALACPAVAMITASHNENGWTGIKMGTNPPLTLGPDEVTKLKEIVLSGKSKPRAGGSYSSAENFRDEYLKFVTKGVALNRPLKIVVACGNGTAGAFAPRALEMIGATVIPVDTELDFTFPKYNPNPEDMQMLRVMGQAVVENGADIGLGFDGDGDRCGVVDENGHEVFADKIGVLLARDLSARHANARFVVDVKSTGIYEIDPVLKKNGATVEYWKTGHSYMKRRLKEAEGLAAFEKSGHYFFAPPLGHGYDDAIVSAVAILQMLDRADGKSLSQMTGALLKTWSSPTMSPECPDGSKYGVVDALALEYQEMKAGGRTVCGQKIADLTTINGIRVRLEDGTWGLVRASSNKPSLVVVVESPTSQAMMRNIFEDIESRLRKHPEVGDFDQQLSDEGPTV